MAADPIQFQLGPTGADMAQLQQKQALINALMQKAQAGPEQGQMVSGHYIRPGIGNALLPAIQLFAAQHAQKRVNDQQQILGQKYQSGLAQAMQQYIQTRNGTPGAPPTGGLPTMSDSDASNLLNNDQPPILSQPATGPAQAGSAPTPGNPFGAAVGAASSFYPQLATLGNEDLKAQLAGQLTPKDIFSNPELSVPSKIAAVQGGKVNPNVVQAAPKVQVANDQIFSVDPTTGTATPSVDARTKYGPFGPVADTPNGPLLGQKADTGEIKTPPPGTNINLNTQQTAADAFAGKLAGARADSLVASRGAALDGVKALSQISDAQAALDNGIKSGAGANIKLLLAKVGKAFGLSDDPAIVNSEGYKAAVMNQVLGSVKTLGSNPSEADREFVNQIKGGDINLDAGTLQHLLKVAKAAAGNDVLAHQHNLAINRDGTGAIPQDLEAMNVPFNFSAPDLEFDSGTGRLRAPVLPKSTAAPKVMHFDAQGNLIQ